VRPGSFLPRPTSRPTIALLALATLVALSVLAAPALAADGVRVIPSSAPWPAGSQFAPDVANQVVVFSDYPALTADPPMYVEMKYLGDDSVPFRLDGSAGATTQQFHPRVYVDDFQSDSVLDPLDTIYAVWSRTTGPIDNQDNDVMIWKGSFNPVGDVWTPASGYPKVLASGPTLVVGAFTPTLQRNPAIGLTNVGGSAGIVVAWEDTRDNGVWAPQIYTLNLSAEAVDDPGWDPATAGNLVDNTDLLARGQFAPEVGPGGVFWLDERWSFWNPGELKDTAVWRADLSSFTPDVFWYDDDHTFDNGQWGEGSLTPTANGAAWLRKGPWGDGVTRPFAKAVGGSGAVLTSLDNTYQLDAFWGFPTTRTVYALSGPHAGVGTDGDIFFYDTNTHLRTPVCDRTGTMPPYIYDSGWPAVGPGPGLARVVWADSRDTTDPSQEEYNSRLYQAFVPSIVFTIRDASILWGSRFRFLTTVAPDFSGTPVYLERMTRGKQQGSLAYLPVKNSRIKATLSANSTASWSWKPPAKGTYYFRVWFPQTAKYNADGAGTSDKYTKVPHIANSSKIIKVTVK